MNTTRRSDEEVNRIIRENLINLRRVNGLSQEEVGKAVGKKKGTVGSWEQGVSLPDLYTLNALANLYGVSLEYIFGREEMSQTQRLASYAHTMRQKKGQEDQTSIFDYMVETEKNAQKVLIEKQTKQDAEDLLRATLDYARQLTEILERMENRDL